MTFKSLVGDFLGLINQAVLVILSIIVAVFITKVIINLTKLDSADGKKKLSQSILFGILGVFFALSFFAIARIIASSLGF